MTYGKKMVTYGKMINYRKNDWENDEHMMGESACFIGQNDDELWDLAEISGI